MRSPCSGSADEVSASMATTPSSSRAGDPCAQVQRRSARSCRPCDRSARAPPSPARRQGQRAPRPAARPWARAAREQGPPTADGRAFRRRVSFSLQKRHAFAARPRRGADEARVRLDRRHVDAANLGDAAGQRRELHRLAKGDEPLAVELRRRKRLERRLDRHVAIQGDELLRDADAA